MTSVPTSNQLWQNSFCKNCLTLASCISYFSLLLLVFLFQQMRRWAVNMYQDLFLNWYFSRLNLNATLQFQWYVQCLRYQTFLHLILHWESGAALASWQKWLIIQHKHNSHHIGTHTVYQQLQTLMLMLAGTKLLVTMENTALTITCFGFVASYRPYIIALSLTT